MQEAKYAPGPWELRALELHEGGVGHEVVAANGEIVCDNQTYYPQKVTKANARLIAAAPEMWETLEAVERWAFGEGIDLSPTVKRRLDELRAKLSQIEGDAA